MESSTCVDAFISNWVARFDVPCAVMTDRGTQFTSLSWTSMCIVHRAGDPAHPHHCIPYPDQWEGGEGAQAKQECLTCTCWGTIVAVSPPMGTPWVLLGICAASKEDSGTSSVELALGSPLLLPGEMLHMPEVPCVHRPPPSTRASIIHGGCQHAVAPSGGSRERASAP
jgi:hypothetical protein